jgi:hypothetical protein
LQPSDPDLFMTKTTSVAYEAGFTDRDWTMAMEAVDLEVADFPQDRFGQALFGKQPPSDEALLLHGLGANGKSTVVGTMYGAFGD